MNNPWRKLENIPDDDLLDQELDAMVDYELEHWKEYKYDNR